MTKHHRTHREKGKCECGMKKQSLRTLSEHAQAKGHRLVKMPRSENQRVS